MTVYEREPEEAPKPKRRLLPWLLGTAIVLQVFLVKYRDINPDAQRGRALLEHLSARDIVSVRLEPARSKSVIATPLTITDRTLIDAVAAALTPMQAYAPNHPSMARSVVVYLRFKDREVGGLLQQVVGVGPTFTYMSEGEAGWVFGTYQVPHGAALFAMADSLSARR